MLSFSIACSSTKLSFYKEEPKVNLYAFVGKKVNIEKFDATVKGPISKYFDKEIGDTVISQKVSLSLDAAFHCTFIVVKSIYNTLPSDTIDFDAYSHYGKLGFEDTDYVLLYISKDTSSKYYHQKYQYDLLVKKNDGFYGQKGETLKELFDKRNGIFKQRGIF